MNDVLKAIMDRRSIRSFKPESLKREDLDTIVEAAFMTPSGRNGQPWHMTVVTDNKLNDSVVEAFKSWHKENDTFNDDIAKSHNFNHAPCVIYFSADKSNPRFAVNDIGAMVQTVALAAYSLGIGSLIVWSALPAFQSLERETLMKKLGIPEGYEPQSTIALGYREGDNPPARERDKTKVNWIG